MNPLLISALVSAALAFGSAWQIQSWRIDSLKLGYANERLAIEQSSSRAIADAQAKVAAAQVDAQIAADRLKRDAAGAVVAGNGLRDTLASAVRAAHTDLQTCTRQVDAIGVVFDQCRAELQEMGRNADEWTNQALVLQQAWPSK